MASKTEYVTLESEIIEHGKNDFIEVALKEARTPDKNTVFLAVSRGFIKRDGSRQYRKSTPLPNDPEVITGVMNGLRKVMLKREHHRQAAPVTVNTHNGNGNGNGSVQ